MMITRTMEGRHGSASRFTSFYDSLSPQEPEQRVKLCPQLRHVSNLKVNPHPSLVNNPARPLSSHCRRCLSCHWVRVFHRRCGSRKVVLAVHNSAASQRSHSSAVTSSPVHPSLHPLGHVDRVNLSCATTPPGLPPWSWLLSSSCSCHSCCGSRWSGLSGMRKHPRGIRKMREGVIVLSTYKSDGTSTVLDPNARSKNFRVRLAGVIHHRYLLQLFFVVSLS